MNKIISQTNTMSALAIEEYIAEKQNELKILLLYYSLTTASFMGLGLLEIPKIEIVNEPNLVDRVVRTGDFDFKLNIHKISQSDLQEAYNDISEAVFFMHYRAASNNFFNMKANPPIDKFYSKGVSDYLEQFFRIKHGDTVLDIGTGRGALFARTLAFEMLQVVATDISQEIIDYAKSITMEDSRASNITYRLTTSTKQTGVADQSMNYVFCGYVTTLYPDFLKRRLINEIMRVLKPEGQVFFTEYKDVALPNTFTRIPLEVLLKEAGFEVLFVKDDLCSPSCSNMYRAIKRK